MGPVAAQGNPPGSVYYYYPSNYGYPPYPYQPAGNFNPSSPLYAPYAYGGTPGAFAAPGSPMSLDESEGLGDEAQPNAAAPQNPYAQVASFERAAFSSQLPPNKTVN